jgi:hypothetical protein
MKPRSNQPGARENTASSRQHASRLAPDIHSTAICIEGKNPATLRSSLQNGSPAEHFENPLHAAPQHAATGGDRGGESHLLTVHEVARLLQVPVPGSMDECENGLGSDCRATGLGSIGVSARTKYWHGSNVSAEVNMLLDSSATLITDAEQAKRAIEGGTMVRRRFQRGSLFKRGKREKVWVARWWEDVINADGTMGRMRRSIVIGTVAEFATRRLAMRALSERLRSLNSGSQRPQTMRTLKDFVQMDWEPVVLPTLKYATQKHYEYMLGVHLIPIFGERRFP